MKTFKLFSVLLLFSVCTIGGHCWGRRHVSGNLDSRYHDHPSFHLRPYRSHPSFFLSPFESFPGHFHSFLDDSTFWNTFMDISPHNDGYNEIDCQRKGDCTKPNIGFENELNDWEQNQYIQWKSEQESRKRAFEERESRANEQYLAELKAEKNRRLQVEKLRQERNQEEIRRKEQAQKEAELKQRRQNFASSPGQGNQNGNQRLNQDSVQQNRQNPTKTREQEKHNDNQRSNQNLVHQRRQNPANSREEGHQNSHRLNQKLPHHGQKSRPDSDRYEKINPPNPHGNTDGKDQQTTRLNTKQIREQNVASTMYPNQIAFLEVPGFKSKDISVKSVDGVLHIRGYKENNNNEHSLVQQFHKSFTISNDIDAKSIQATIDSNGLLIITGAKRQKFEEENYENEELIEFIDVENEEPFHSKDFTPESNDFTHNEKEYQDDDVVIEIEG